MTGSRPEQPCDRQIDRDGENEEPLGRVEAGPQRHSDDPFYAQAREMILPFVPPSRRGRELLPAAAVIVAAIAAALRAVDRAAREECARIADGSAGPFPQGKRIAADGSEAREIAIAMQHGLGGGRDAIAAAIRQTIKP